MSADSAKPPRPHLPPVLLAGLVLWAVTALWWPRARTLDEGILVGAAAAGSAVAVLVFAWGLRRKRVSVAAIALLGAAVALAASSVGAAALTSSTEALVGREGPWECTLTTDAKATDFGFRAEARIVDGEGRVISARLLLPEEGEGMLRGTRFSVSAPLKAPGDSSEEYFWNAGLVGTLVVSAVPPDASHQSAPFASLREQAIHLIGRYGGQGAPLLQALLCGWRPAIEETGAYEQFKTVGLAHLVAVSGAHLSIVTLFVAQILGVLRLGRRFRACATALFLGGYVCFTGMPVSALRAAVMAGTGLLALVTDRRNSALTALGACIVLFVGLDPTCALSASFVLSAGSTLGIVLVAPLILSAFGSCPRRARSLIGEPLSLTAASALATQPYAAALFAQVPLLSPIANIAAAPLFALACTVGFVAVLVGLAAPPAAPAAIGVADLTARALGWIVDLLARVPGSCLPVDAEVVPMVCLSAVMLGGLWAWWPTLRPRMLALGLVVPLAAVLVLVPFASGASHPEDEIVMLNVGQGDAFLVRSRGASLLIDTGNQDGMLKEAVARQGVRRLDAVAITHPDDDHCGSLAALGDVALVGGLLVAEDLLTCPCDACTDLRDTAAREEYRSGIAGLSVGDEVSCGRFTLRVVWPRSFSDEGGNADSLSFLCSWDGDGDGAAEWTTLFCGDAEADELRAMVSDLPSDGIDVLKVGHHGSKKSIDGELAAALRPSVALIGVGERNRYGHPAPAVCETLAAAGAEVLCSDERGDVSVAFSMEKLTVRSQNDAPAS